MTAQPPDPNWQPHQQPSTAPVKDKRRFTAGQVLGVLLVIVLIIFIVENTDKVDVRLVGPEVRDVPLAVALIIAALLGALVTLLIMWRHSRRRTKELIFFFNE
jgi:uncharacterized integral membrane protein